MSEKSPGAGVELVELNKTFPGGATAVDGVDLDVAPGEFMTFLGPSGSGKTTTLNMVAGLEEATAGAIRLDGTAIDALPPHRRNLGMVFQQYALFPHMTAGQNIAFPLRQRGVPKAEIHSRVGEALDLVRLAGLADRLPSQLSGGQQQRVALARAVVFGPRALLMDEPLGALDKQLRVQLQAEITRIHRELGTTVLFVTHDQEEALALSDRIAIFNHGRIEQSGGANELYETPTSLFVANFIGESNTFSGTVGGDSTGRWIDTGHGRVAVAASTDFGDAERACAVIRPERMVLGPAHDGQASLRARVVRTVYQGAFRRVILDIAGATGTVREPAGTESAVSPGDEVNVSYDPRTVAVVPGDPDTPTGTPDAAADTGAGHQTDAVVPG